MTQRRGWCPSLFEPMESGDGLLLRVKPRGAVLPAPAARRLAEAARRFGNGWITLTNRGNLQVRGVRADGVAGFTEAALEAGLSGDDPAAERRRNVITSPLAGDDPALPAGLARLVAAVESALSDAAFAGLPGKFGVAVDGGGVLPLRGVRADVLVGSAHGRMELRLDGSPLAVVCKPGVGPVRTLLLAFLALGRHMQPRPARMLNLVRSRGAPAVFAAAGMQASTMRLLDGDPPDPIGWLRYGSLPRGAVGVGLPSGQIEASGLVALAVLAERAGEGTLRTTPWRALMLPGIPAEAAAAVLRDAGALGLIVQPGDARRRVIACPGRPGCASASVDTQGAARYLIESGLVPKRGLLHVSGCAKGCAHPAPAALTLVGSEGLFGIVRDGRAGDHPSGVTTTLQELRLD